MPTTPAAPVTHRLEAFRDAKTDAVEARGEDAKHDPRRPKTLADIYRRPAEICFNGEAAPPPHPGPYRPAAPAPGCPRLVLMLRCCRMQARSTSCGRRGESRAAGSSSTSSRPPSAPPTSPPTRPTRPSRQLLSPPESSLACSPLRACQAAAPWQEGPHAAFTHPALVLHSSDLPSESSVPRAPCPASQVCVAAAQRRHVERRDLTLTLTLTLHLTLTLPLTLALTLT